MNPSQYISAHPWKWTLFVVIFTTLIVLHAWELFSWIPYAGGALVLLMYAVIRWDCHREKVKASSQPCSWNEQAN